MPLPSDARIPRRVVVPLKERINVFARETVTCRAHIIREKNGGFYTAEAFGYSQEFTDYIKDIPVKAERGSASERWREHTRRTWLK